VADPGGCLRRGPPEREGPPGGGSGREPPPGPSAEREDPPARRAPGAKCAAPPADESERDDPPSRRTRTEGGGELPHVPSDDDREEDLLEVVRELNNLGFKTNPVHDNEMDDEGVKEIMQVQTTVDEVFCKDRFTSQAVMFGVQPGYEIPTVARWDLDDPKQELEARKSPDRVRRFLPVGSPECSNSFLAQGSRHRCGHE